MKYDAVWNMPLQEYLNAVSVMQMMSREREERLTAAATQARQAKSNETYILALIQEIVHLRV